MPVASDLTRPANPETRKAKQMVALPSTPMRDADEKVSATARGGSRGRIPSQRTRVVIITNILPPYRLPLCRSLASRSDFEFEIWLMATHEKNRRWSVEQAGLPVRRFADRGVDFSDKEGPVVHFNPGMLLALWRERPTLVILGGYDSATNDAAAVFLKILRIPFLFWIESTRLERGVLRYLAGPMLRILVRSSGGVIVPGLSAEEYALDLGGNSLQAFRSPNSVDVTRFAPETLPGARVALRRSLGLPNGVLFLYVGRLTERKGLLDLIGAFTIIASQEKNAHLIVVGDGPLSASLSYRIARDPLVRNRIHLRGYRSYDELPLYYAACDIFVFPSHRDAWGLVINEAMSSGLPVISTDRAGAARDLLEDGFNGYVIPYGDRTQLSNRMRELFASDELRIQMGKMARERVVSGFTPERQTRGIIDAVKAVLAKDEDQC